MFATKAPRLRVAAIAAAALTVPATLLASTPAQAAPASDRTSAQEAQRVDRIPTPKLNWADCSSFSPGAQCTTVNLPMDYDQPKGPQTAVAVLRIKATDQKHKLGTLFLNPGGPGGSGVGMAAFAPLFLGPQLLARFDIVGFDPRGTNYSDNVRCWRTQDEQSTALSGMNVSFPWTSAEKTAYVKSAKAFGKACSTTGTPLSGSMSTAEVARDMDVLRRAVGDKQLTYLGFSYGTYLGQVYANMFPDRVRAVVIDGVIDPIAWAGTPANNSIPQTVRLRSGEGAAKALHEVLVRCKTAGPGACTFAATGDPLASYGRIVTGLKKAPLTFTDPDGNPVTISYADLVAGLLGLLYDPAGSAVISDVLSQISTLMQAPAAPGTPAAAKQAQARSSLPAFVKARKADSAKAAAPKSGTSPFPTGFPYYNGAESFQSVLCTDGLNPADAGTWPAYADAADKKAPDFGRVWTWASAPCASKTWTVHDEDAYSGPFTRRTVNPVLVVGNYWDPATNYDGAVKAASLLPNSRLISSDSWGHTAYGTSACVTTAVEDYLLTKKVPAKGLHCVGDVQPFPTSLASITAQAATGNHRAPVVPILPVKP
jgi:pimeloyl-ACP methyl ester carboxylesterase